MEKEKNMNTITLPIRIEEVLLKANYIQDKDGMCFSVGEIKITGIRDDVIFESLSIDYSIKEK